MSTNDNNNYPAYLRRLLSSPDAGGASTSDAPAASRRALSSSPVDVLDLSAEEMAEQQEAFAKFSSAHAKADARAAARRRRPATLSLTDLPLFPPDATRLPTTSLLTPTSPSVDQTSLHPLALLPPLHSPSIRSRANFDQLRLSTVLPPFINSDRAYGDIPMYVYGSTDAGRGYYRRRNIPLPINLAQSASPSPRGDVSSSPSVSLSAPAPGSSIVNNHLSDNIRNPDRAHSILHEDGLTTESDEVSASLRSTPSSSRPSTPSVTHVRSPTPLLRQGTADSTNSDVNNAVDFVPLQYRLAFMRVPSPLSHPRQTRLAWQMAAQLYEQGFIPRHTLTQIVRRELEASRAGRELLRQNTIDRATLARFVGYVYDMLRQVTDRHGLRHQLDSSVAVNITSVNHRPRDQDLRTRRQHRLDKLLVDYRQATTHAERTRLLAMSALPISTINSMFRNNPNMINNRLQSDNDNAAG